MAPLQGPDEQNHAAYVQYLAETGRGPTFGAVGRTYSTESSQFQRWASLRALVGVLAARPGWTQAEQQRYGQIDGGLTESQRRDGGRNNPVAQNPPLYYLYQALPYRAILAVGGSLPTRLLWMRLANIPLYLLIVACAWLIVGAVLGRRRWPQTVGAGAAALLPQLAFMSGVVNPDIALSAIWAALIYVALLILRRPPSAGLVIGFGALAGASAATHGRGLAAAVPAVLVLAMTLWRFRDRPRRWLAGAFGGALAALAAGVGAAFAYSSAHGGIASLGGESTRAGGSVKGFLSYLWQFYLPRLDTMTPPLGPPYGYRQVYIHGFFGTFGSLEIAFPTWVYDSLQVATGAGLVVLVICLARRWERVRSHADKLIVLLAFLGSMVLLVHIASYRDLQAPLHDPLFTGRYLLPLTTLFALALAFVVDSLRERAAVAFGSAALAAGVLLSLAGLGLTLERFYV